MRASTLLLLTCFILVAVAQNDNISPEPTSAPYDSYEVTTSDADEAPESRVMELTDLQFQEVLDSSVYSSSYVFAKFWAPWCPFSTLLHPLFDEVSILFPNVTFVGVDTSRFYGVNSRWGIVAFPTLVLFGKGDPITKCHNRSLEGMIKFLSDRTKMALSRDSEPAYTPIFAFSFSSPTPPPTPPPTPTPPPAPTPSPSSSSSSSSSPSGPPNPTIANPPTVQRILHAHFGHHVYLYFAVAFLAFRVAVYYMQKKILRDTERLKYD